MEEGSEMAQSPTRGDRDKNNSVWHVRSVYFVPGPVLRALCGASQRQAVVDTFNIPTFQPRRRAPGSPGPCQTHRKRRPQASTPPANYFQKVLHSAGSQRGQCHAHPGLWPGRQGLSPFRSCPHSLRLLFFLRATPPQCLSGSLLICK